MPSQTSRRTVPGGSVLVAPGGSFILAADSTGARLNDDLLRDTAVVALLHAGNPAAAREAFDRMGKFSKRKPQDFRVLLLEAHLIAAESRKAAGR